MSIQNRHRLIVAIDEPEERGAMALIDSLGASVTWLKIGMTLYYRSGAPLIRRLVDNEWNIFLDLKCHDIPHQVAGAVTSIAELGVGLITVHTAGGGAMLEAAVKAAEGSGTKVLGVTVLTSMDRALLKGTGIDRDSEALVRARTQLALSSGLDGVVASPLEAELVRSLVPSEFEIVTPGIRPPGANRDDQKRIATPESAIKRGATRLVVGRPITRAAQPAIAASAILSQIQGASS